MSNKVNTVPGFYPVGQSAPGGGWVGPTSAEVIRAAMTGIALGMDVAGHASHVAGLIRHGWVLLPMPADWLAADRWGRAAYPSTFGPGDLARAAGYDGPAAKAPAILGATGPAFAARAAQIQSKAEAEAIPGMSGGMVVYSNTAGAWERLEGYGEREALREAQAATQAAYMAKVANHV